MKVKKGFTLIELLIVIAIIGVLSVAFLPSLLGAPSKGRDASRVAQVKKIQNFLVTEGLSNTTLPVSGCVGSATPIGTLINSNIADFGGVFPIDPQASNNVKVGSTDCTGGQYGYVKLDSGSPYSAAVFARVENTENANVLCTTAGAWSGSTTPTLISGFSSLSAANACFASLIQ